jgi:hypothetical protein
MKPYRLLSAFLPFCLCAVLGSLLLAPCSLLTAQPPGSWTADMTSNKIPSGVTLNDVDTLTSPVKLRFTVDLDATIYDNATQATAFNAIGPATRTAILNTYLAAQGIDTAELSVVHVVIKNIDRRWDTFDHPDPLLQYIVAEDIYRVTGLVKYLVE